MVSMTPELLIRRGGRDAPAISVNGDQTASFSGSFWDGTQFSRAGNIYLALRGTPTAGNVPSAWTVQTAGATGAPVNRLQLNEAGLFYPVTDNAYSLGASGVRWSSIWAANSVIQTSDATDKTDIEGASLGLDWIKKLRLVSFRWIEGGKRVVRQVYLDANGDEIPDGQQIPDDATPGRVITESVPGKRRHWGFLAQEVKASLPKDMDFGGWVIGEDGKQGLRPDQLIAPLVKAVQELSQRIVQLESNAGSSHDRMAS
jgi:hypothetical protein